jgi:hypothetical protein
MRISTLGLNKEYNVMAKVSKGGQGKTLYIELSLYPCGQADPRKNLTISCPDKDTQFKTTLSDNGLKKFKEEMLSFYEKHVLNRNV